ncbi:MarR family transcriptional regulator [Eubacterium sp. 1001713B170207_170306_E7]|uniref:MarR family winged helix-turn-helix transcriptional regulator n=1 Tax=Eubacterium sp. 1001713B170207_170306_E7 TaxID=2787097 RepID=UPI00189C1DAF|nr:MarR family transcriptional regulator [Eubacterium sp. 1001713B170207_170306_E7]
MPDNLHETLKAYYDFWFSCNALYEKWAKGQGITVNTLFVIYTVNEYRQDCNQRLICEKLMLPKQTVNTILEALTKKGIVQKKADPSDKRNKRIVFTQAGETYAGPLLKRLSTFEEKALGAMTPEQREDFTQNSQVMLARLEEALASDS